MKNDIYNNLKNRYEERSLKPSENLWEELEQKLETSLEKPKQSKKYYWFAAASLVLLLGIYSVFKMESPEVVEHSTMVKNKQETSEIIKTIENKDIIEEIIPKNITKTISENEEEKKLVAKKQEVEPKIIVEKIEEKPIIPVEKLPIDTKIVKELYVDNKLPNKEKETFVTTEDLLFYIEAEKLKGKKSPQKQGFAIDLKKYEPQSIEILGISIYENQKKN